MKSTRGHPRGRRQMVVICALPAVLVGVGGAWPLALLFAFAGAGNVWFVDQGARRLSAESLEH